MQRRKAERRTQHVPTMQARRQRSIPQTLRPGRLWHGVRTKPTPAD
jgi:hypothetical protein